MRKRVSIEIGKNYIKIVEGSYRKKIIINKIYETASDEDLIKDDSRVEEELLYNLLGDGVVNNNFSRRDITVVLAGIANILIREMTIPLLSPEKTYSLLKFEARQSFPVNTENFVIDYKQLSFFNEGKAKKQRILMVAVPRSIVAGILNVAERLSLRIKRIDLEANSLLRLVNKERESRNENDNEVFMIVNLMRYYVTVAIAKDKNLLFAKTFPVYELESVFRADDTANDLVLNYYNYMINEVIENIVKFYDFFKVKKQEDETLSKVYLTGELCQKIDIKDSLRLRMNSEVLSLESLNILEKQNVLGENRECYFTTTISGLL